MRATTTIRSATQTAIDGERGCTHDIAIIWNERTIAKSSADRAKDMIIRERRITPLPARNRKNSFMRVRGISENPGPSEVPPMKCLGKKWLRS